MKNPLVPIFLIVAVDILGLTIVIPLLPFYAEKYGASPFVVGCLVTSYALCQLISGPVLGTISDHLGRRPLLLVSQIGTFIGFLILARAETLWLVFLARIIDGLTAGNISLAQAYISDVTEPQNRAKAFGIIGVSFGLGFLIGPAISGFLSQYGYTYPIYASAALSFTSILATYFLLPGDSHLKGKAEAGGERRLSPFEFGFYLKYFKMPALAPYLYQFLFFALSFSLFLGGFALFSERRFYFGPKEVGYVFAYTGFLGMIIQGGWMGRLTKRYGEWKLILWGFLLSCLGYIVLGLSFSVLALMVSATISSFGNGVLRPSLMSVITQRSGRGEQGTVLGLTQSLNSIAQIVCPLTAGALIEFHWLTPWALLAAIMTAAGAWVLLKEREEQFAIRSFGTL